ncbi:hypothetical protein [Devosia sp. A449]
MTDLLDNAGGENSAQHHQNDAHKAYQDLQIQQLAERVIHQAGRSATPDFLKAVAYQVIALANAKGGAR